MLQSIEPKSPLLRNYIKLYYLHKADFSDYAQNLIYYPNYTATLNIYKNTRVERAEHSRTHYFYETECFQQLLVAKTTKSYEIRMRGTFHKITIVFHPLGINHFVDVPFGQFVQEHYSVFGFFKKDLDVHLNSLFESETMEEKRDILDAFFKDKFVPFKEQRLITAVNKILISNDNLKVIDIANHLNISRKTLLRIFKKHLNFSVEEYLANVKFRKALINYQSKNKKPKLTELAYESNYYDQSDFIHDMKNRVGLTPRELFRQLETIQEGLFWTVT